MNNKTVTAIIVGAGHRALVYSELAKTNPEMLKIVGVADPNPIRRKKTMEYFGFSVLKTQIICHLATIKSFWVKLQFELITKVICHY